MVDTGITLASALSAIIEQEQNPSLKKVLIDLRSAVEAGEDFSAALARHPKFFDRTYVALIRVSEVTGSLPEMLDRISVYLRKQLETRNKVRAAMAYPAVMMVMAVCVTIFLLTYVLPKFTPIFESRAMQLPGPTRFLMTASAVLMDHWPWWLAGAAAVIAGAVFGIRTEQGRQAWDWIKISLPVVGSAMRKVIISRTIRTLGVMVQGGISMLDAIRLAADVSGNFFYERLWLKVLDDVTNGSEIYAALSGNPLMPATLVQMIKSGEETGKLHSVLGRVSDYYDDEVETSLKAATSLIEPLMIAAMGIVVGGIGLALLLPVFSLSKPGG
jgi:type IV pilus assembly protein PilC